MGKTFPEPSGFQITRWNSDPFSLGSYSYTPVGSKQSYRRQIGMPVENKVFFAGEATSQFFPATVHGAFLSGVRAAYEIMMADTKEDLMVEGNGADRHLRLDHTFFRPSFERDLDILRESPASPYSRSPSPVARHSASAWTRVPVWLCGSKNRQAVAALTTPSQAADQIRAGATTRTEQRRAARASPRRRKSLAARSGEGRRGIAEDLQRGRQADHSGNAEGRFPDAKHFRLGKNLKLETLAEGRDTLDPSLAKAIIPAAGVRIKGLHTPRIADRPRSALRLRLYKEFSRFSLISPELPPVGMCSRDRHSPLRWQCRPAQFSRHTGSRPRKTRGQKRCSWQRTSRLRSRC